MNYLLLAMKLAEHTMSQIPNYEQRKKKEYFKLKNNLNDSWNAPYETRDDDLILNLQDKMSIFLEAFYEEIKK